MLLHARLFVENGIPSEEESEPALTIQRPHGEAVGLPRAGHHSVTVDHVSVTITRALTGLGSSPDTTAVELAVARPGYRCKVYVPPFPLGPAELEGQCIAPQARPVGQSSLGDPLATTRHGNSSALHSESLGGNTRWHTHSKMLCPRGVCVAGSVVHHGDCHARSCLHLCRGHACDHSFGPGPRQFNRGALRVTRRQSSNPFFCPRSESFGRVLEVYRGITDQSVVVAMHLCACVRRGCVSS